MPKFLLFLLPIALGIVQAQAQVTAQSWRGPVFSFGQRMGRLEANVNTGFPGGDHSREGLIGVCPDGAGGAFVASEVKRGAKLEGLPDSSDRPPGFYLGRLDYRGQFSWVRLLGEVSENFGTYQIWPQGISEDGHGGCVIWGQNTDSLTLDSVRFFGNHIFPYHGSTKTAYPFVAGFSSNGNCRWVRQIGSGGMGYDTDKFFSSQIDTAGIWLARNYYNLDSTAHITPFVLPADSFGIAFFHLHLPDGQIDKAATIKRADPLFNPTDQSIVSSYSIVSTSGGGLLWYGALFARTLVLGVDTLHGPHGGKALTFLGRLDTDSRWSLQRSFPTAFRDAPIAKVIPGILTRYVFGYNDSIHLPGLATLKRSVPPYSGLALAEMDTLGNWLSLRALPLGGTLITERRTSYGTELIWACTWGNNSLQPCYPFGQDTICPDFSQPDDGLLIAATDSTGTVFKWAINGGGLVSSIGAGCLMYGPTLLTVAAARAWTNSTFQAFFAGPYLLPSQQTNLLLTGLLLPETARPVADKALLVITKAGPYPNPVGAGGVFEWKGQSGPASQVSIYDLSGRRLAELAAVSGSYQVPLGLPVGLYLLKGEGRQARLLVH